MNRYLFLCVSVLFAAITALPMTATASWQPEITIGLSQGVSEVRLSATSGALYVYDDPEKETMMRNTNLEVIATDIFGNFYNLIRV